MQNVPTNRRVQAMREMGGRVAGNAREVGDAFRMRSRAGYRGAHERRVGPTINVGGIQFDVGAASGGGAALVGAFAGALAGVCVGTALGAGVGAALGPVVAFLLIIAMAIGGACLLGSVCSDSCIGILIGGAIGLGLGGFIGMFIASYIVLLCPIIAAIFTAYHGSVHGVQLGRTAAARFGAMTSAAMLSALAGISIGLVWLAIHALNHPVTSGASIMFLVVVTFAVTVIGTLASLGAYIFSGEALDRQVDRSVVFMWIPGAGLIGLILFFCMPQREQWTHLELPPSLFRNWTDQLRSTPSQAPSQVFTQFNVPSPPPNRAIIPSSTVVPLPKNSNALSIPVVKAAGAAPRVAEPPVANVTSPTDHAQHRQKPNPSNPPVASLPPSSGDHQLHKHKPPEPPQANSQPSNSPDDHPLHKVKKTDTPPSTDSTPNSSGDHPLHKKPGS